MLSKEHRLSKQKDFDHVFKKGKQSYDSIIGIKLISNKEKNSRFGIVISNKISKKAVVRNKIKRKIRAIIHQELAKLKEDQDCILIASPQIEKATFEDIEKSIIKHFKTLLFYQN